MLHGSLHPDVAVASAVLAGGAALLARRIPALCARLLPVFGTTACLAVALAGRADGTKQVGLVLLGSAAWIDGPTRARRGSAAAVAFAGLLALARQADVMAPLPRSAPLAVPAIVVVACCLAWCHRHLGLRLTLAMLGSSACMVWGAAPDTEEPLALLVVVAVALGSALLPARDRQPAGPAQDGDVLGAIGLAAAYAWAAFEGGRGRPLTIVASFAALGLCVALPALAVAVRSRREVFRGPFVVLLVLAGQVATGLVGGRIAGVATARHTTILLVTASAVGSLAVAAVVLVHDAAASRGAAGPPAHPA